MHCALYKFVIFEIFVVEESIRNFNKLFKFRIFFTTDCADYTDFSSQGATMVEDRTIRMAGAAEAQKIRIIRAIRCGKTLPNLSSTKSNDWQDYFFRVVRKLESHFVIFHVVVGDINRGVLVRYIYIIYYLLYILYTLYTRTGQKMTIWQSNFLTF